MRHFKQIEDAMEAVAWIAERLLDMIRHARAAL